MTANITIKFDLDSHDLLRMQNAQEVLIDIRDAIAKTGLAEESRELLQDTIDLLTDIGMGQSID